MLRVGVLMYQTSASKGQELVAQRMVRELRRLGHEAYLITSQFHDGEPVVEESEIAARGGFIHTYDEELGIPVIRLAGWKATWPPRRIFIKDLTAALDKLVEDLRLNVLITHSTLWNGPEEVAKYVAWKRALARSGVPQGPLLFCHMSHYQDPYDPRYFVEERTYRQTWNESALPRILAEADLLLCVTPLEQEAMVKAGARPEKCFLFPGGIDAESLQHLPDTWLPNVPSGKKLISYLGTVEERKNTLAVLKVAKELLHERDLHFVIAGKLEGEYGERVKQEAQGLRNVTLLGPITDAEKAALIKASYANILLSRSEALGLAQLEHMYMGVPIITSGVGGQAWLIRDGEEGLVVRGPDDLEGAARAVLLLARNPKLRAKMGRRAQQRVRHLTIMELTLALSKRLLDLLRGKQAEGEARLAPPEKVLEAWVRGRERILSTTERLILQKGASIISIPYSEIVRIRRHKRPRWWVLGLGLLITAALGAAGLLRLGLYTRLSLLLGGMGLANPLLTVEAMRVSLPLLSLGLGLLAFLLSRERGFLVSCASGLRVFIGEAYERALRIADSLTPQELFEE